MGGCGMNLGWGRLKGRRRRGRTRSSGVMMGGSENKLGLVNRKLWVGHKLTRFLRQFCEM